MKLLLQSAKNRTENCTKRIPDKRNLDRLELLNQSVIPEIEISIATILNKLDSFGKELNKYEVQLDDAHKRPSMLSNVLKNDASFKSSNTPNLSDLLVNTLDETTKVEELKMLNDVVTEPLLDLDKCSLSELITILQKIAKDPTINGNQAGFGSYIANHVLKEKIDRYNKESMIPPKRAWGSMDPQDTNNYWKSNLACYSRFGF
jgi:hypothetical protein